MLLLVNNEVKVANDAEILAVIRKNEANVKEVIAGVDGRCPRCGIPGFGETYCDVCLTMINAVRRQPGLRAAHDAWEKENEGRINLLRRQKEN